MSQPAGRANAGAVFGQYVRFCLVGGSGVAVDMGLLWLLADPRMLGWNLTLGKVLAAEVALLNNFAWNDTWTFREEAKDRPGWRPRLARLLRFNLICLGGMAVSVGLLLLQVSWFRWHLYAANFNAIVVASLWNFLLNKKYGWGGGTPERRHP